MFSLHVRHSDYACRITSNHLALRKVCDLVIGLSSREENIDREKAKRRMT